MTLELDGSSRHLEATGLDLQNQQHLALPQVNYSNQPMQPTVEAQIDCRPKSSAIVASAYPGTLLEMRMRPH